MAAQSGAAVRVIDHHVAAGSVPVDDPASPRQYPVELIRHFGSPMPAPLAGGRVVDAVEQRFGFKFRVGLQSRDGLGAEDVLLSLSEQVAFPLALADRRRHRHVMLAHNLVTPLKDRLHRLFGWYDWFDAVVVLSDLIADHLINEHGVDAERVTVLDHPIDTDFFRPAPGASEDGLIVAVGREHRDYELLAYTLARHPELRAVVIANSPWAKGSGVQTGRGVEPTALLSTGRLEFVDWVDPATLRRWLERASVVAIPLQAATRFAAGVTSLAESQAMGKAIVMTASPGLAGRHRPGAAVAVQPGDRTGFADRVAELAMDATARAPFERAARTHAVAVRTMADFASSMDRVVEGIG